MMKRICWISWFGLLALGQTPRVHMLGVDDQVVIQAADAPDLSGKTVRIGSDGMISLPMVGRIQAGGMTVEQLETELVRRLKVYIKEPQVSVNLAETHSLPVSVIGSVTTPGVHQIQGKKTLVEVLSQAGGLRADAGYSVKITRKKESGPIPLASAKEDATGQFSVAEVRLRDIMEAKNPAENILVMPNDVISVPRAEMIYVIGEVVKPGSIVLGDQQNMSVLQALSLASGLGKVPKSKEARLLRLAPGTGGRTEISVNLKDMLTAKSKDMPMQAEDILFVPNSVARTMTMKAVEMMISTGATALLYVGAR